MASSEPPKHKAEGKDLLQSCRRKVDKYNPKRPFCKMCKDLCFYVALNILVIIALENLPEFHRLSLQENNIYH